MPPPPFVARYRLARVDTLRYGLSVHADPVSAVTQARARVDRLKALRNAAVWHAKVAAQRFGMDVGAHHFYSNEVDYRTLRDTLAWRRPHEMTGVRGHEVRAQATTVRGWLSDEVRTRLSAGGLYWRACDRNRSVGYGPIESDVLYGFVSAVRPSRIIQVGAGVSTAVMLEAAADAALDVDIRCIDPYPNEFLRSVHDRGEITLIAAPAQQVDLAVFGELRDGDLLFVDSTHTVKPGSEVNRIILDILPTLAPGVHVHFHDIYFPYDYVGNLLHGALFAWNETALLHAFLINNDRAEITVSCSMLHHACPDSLRELLPWYNPVPMHQGLVESRRAVGHFPSSTYLRIAPQAAPAPSDERGVTPGSAAGVQ